jgi:hypothetical protein
MKSRVGAIAILLTLAASHAAAQNRPNVILIYTDDLRYGDVSAYGLPRRSSPESRAEAGARRRCRGDRLSHRLVLERVSIRRNQSGHNLRPSVTTLRTDCPRAVGAEPCPLLNEGSSAGCVVRRVDRDNSNVRLVSAGRGSPVQFSN